MNGKVIRVVDSNKFITLLIWIQEDGVCGRTYTGEKYRNYHNWCDFKVGDHIGGLEWKDKARKILDADSPVYSLEEVTV